MSQSNQPTPKVELPGAFPETPSIISREQSYSNYSNKNENQQASETDRPDAARSSSSVYSTSATQQHYTHSPTPQESRVNYTTYVDHVAQVPQTSTSSVYLTEATPQSTNAHNGAPQDSFDEQTSSTNNDEAEVEHTRFHPIAASSNHRADNVRRETDVSSVSTIIPSPHEDSDKDEKKALGGGLSDAPQSPVETHDAVATGSQDDGAPEKNEKSQDRPQLAKQTTRRTENDLFQVLSRRKTTNTNLGRQTTRSTVMSSEEEAEEQAEINRLLSRMFGHTRQETSAEEKTRHKGVIFRDLTVKGMGLGAAVQPTSGDVFMNFPRFLWGLFTRGPRKAAGKPPVRTIINDFTGCIKPGEMLLVLGRPGAGCSTFLKVLGNQRFGYERIEGDVKYGGTDASEMAKNYRSEVLYNPEDDVLFATLKVKDTLKFALKTRTPGKDSRNEGETRGQYIQEFLRVVSKLFWIEHTMNTKVGNSLIRGVSGGEKKRVGIAEAMITKATVQSWDNSTRGLDASTALEYVQSIRAMTNMADASTSVALYQAGESLYQLFDKVLLIDEGECCYFGPAEQAATYFKELGFEKNPRWTTADFLTSVTDLHERKVKEGWEDRVPRSAHQFGDAFRKSKQFMQNKDEVEAFEAETMTLKQERDASMTKTTRQKNYTVSFYKQVIACTHRQFLVMIGDPASLWGKWAGILFQAVIVGALFYNLPQTSAGAFTRGGVLFFILLFNALLALAELTAAFENRPILLKHKSFSFYRPSAYAIAQIVVDAPLVFVQVLIFDVVVYFMANLQRTASQFFISILLLWIITMSMYAFFRAIGALVGSLDVATRITGVAIQALIVYTGYLIPPTKMYPWFSWLRWINPIQYGFEALVANEFYNLEIQCEPPYLVPPYGQPGFQSCALQGSTPGSTIVNGADYISVAYSYTRDHLWRNFGIICAFFVFFAALTMFGMEIQKPNKGGGAVTVFKRGQAPKSVEKALKSNDVPSDEEKQAISDSSSQEKESQDDPKEYQAPEGVAKNEAIFTWQNVNYSIPFEKSEKVLLQDVQGYVKPGKLTALMGASGAGKTTLLNTLAQRIRFGVVTGDFLVDGTLLPKSFQRSTGFAEQMDVHETTATVREALRFSAKLRQPREVPLQEKYDYCEKIIDLLEMREIAGAAIGLPGSGLNQEQRKRLTIGVELASKPELLMFLDEPTSGLDSGAAFNIVRFLRKLADAGQAILCTIHQPSSVLFEHFDQLLLLKSGGRTVYFGPLGKDSKDMIGYLERNGAKKCPPKANPAEYMLDAIGAGNPDYKGPDFADIWQKSPENGRLSEEIRGIIRDRQAVGEERKKDDREFAMPLVTQISSVVYRAFTSMWRSPDYIIGMMMLHIVTGLFNAFTFWRLGYSFIDMQSRLFSIFMTLTICPPLIQQLQPRFLEARNLYESREGNSKIYSWLAFVCGAVVSELPYRVVGGTVYWACWYFAPAFPRDTYTAASMWLMVITFEFYYLGFGQAIASFCPNELFASLLVPIFFTFIVSFCGVVVPYAALIPFWRDWMYWLTPFKYLLESMLALLVDGLPVQCADTEMAYFRAPAGQTCQSYTQPFIQQAGGYVTVMPDGQCGFCQYASGNEFAASFNVSPAYIWRDFGIFWGFTIFNFAVVFVCSYIYLSGGRKFLQKVSPKARRNQREMEKRQKQQAEKV